MRILLLGDLILDEPDPDALFEPSRELLRSADLVVGQVEVPHSRRGSVQSTDVPARPADPDNLAALERIGLDVATLAGNHIADAGREGIEDTLDGLHALGIATAGAGMSLDEARRPAVADAAGRTRRRPQLQLRRARASRGRGRRRQAARTSRCSRTTSSTMRAPAARPASTRSPTPESLAAMRDDIAALREQADVVVVALHKGIGHVRARLAQYERDVAHAAIDAGADIVAAHHAHILRGVEVYRGRPIFHGLGNFVTVTRALSVDDTATPEAAAWAQRRRRAVRLHPRPRHADLPVQPREPAHDDRRLPIAGNGTVETGFVPCWIDDDARPVPLGEADGAAVVDYVEAITREAGLTTAYRWDGDRVVCT